MSSLADYFAQHRPQPKYQVGDRVEGVYQGVPYIGTVGGDNLRNYDEGPMVTVHLDLPLKAGDTWHMNFIRVKYKDIKDKRK